LREIDHFGTPPPLLLRQVVIEAAGKGEQECDGVAGKMLVVAAAHVRDDDVTLDQLVIKPCTAEAGSVGANPAQFCSSRQQLRWHCAVGVTAQSLSASKGEHQILSVPVQLRRSGREIRMLIDRTDLLAIPKPDPRLIKLLIRAHRFNATLVGSAGVPFAALAKQEGVSRSYFTRLVRLN
jgi:hypothetical protein